MRGPHAGDQTKPQRLVTKPKSKQGKMLTGDGRFGDQQALHTRLSVSGHLNENPMLEMKPKVYIKYVLVIPSSHWKAGKSYRGRFDVGRMPSCVACGLCSNKNPKFGDRKLKASKRKYLQVIPLRPLMLATAVIAALRINMWSNRSC